MRVIVGPPDDPSRYQFSHRLRVRFAETDAMGVVHHAAALVYLEDARVEYLRAVGHPYAELRSGGVDIAVLEVAAAFLRPLRFDELVDVHLRLARASRTTFQLDYLVTAAGSTRMTAATVHGCVGPSGRATRLPDWLAELA